MSSKQITGERICNVIKHTAFWLKTSHAGMEPVLTQSPTELEIKLKIKKYGCHVAAETCGSITEPFST